MSASEKLKALDAQASPTPWDWDERVVDPYNSVYHLTSTVSDVSDDVSAITQLRNALPQIVAVVEAAEQIRLPNPVFFQRLTKVRRKRSCHRAKHSLLPSLPSRRR